MANRNVFEFLLSNEIKQINVSGGLAMVYHGAWVSNTMYDPGSIVKVVNGTLVDIYIAVDKTDTKPDTFLGWEMFVGGQALVARTVLDSNGLVLVDSDGNIIKTF